MRESSRIAALTGILVSLTACGARPATPLTIAAADGDLRSIDGLLASGVPADEMGRDGLTPLMWAARKGRTEAMTRLLDAGAAIDGRDLHYHGWTPLLHAIHKGETAAAHLLIERGADINAPANNGLTPLIAAAAGCDCDSPGGEKALEEIFFELLGKGADPRAEMSNHTNALANAVAAGRTVIVRALLAKAPDLRISDTLEGRASFLLARLMGRAEIVAMIRNAKAGS